ADAVEHNFSVLCVVVLACFQDDLGLFCIARFSPFLLDFGAKDDHPEDERDGGDGVPWPAFGPLSHLDDKRQEKKAVFLSSLRLKACKKREASEILPDLESKKQKGFDCKKRTEGFLEKRNKFMHTWRKGHILTSHCQLLSFPHNEVKKNMKLHGKLCGGEHND
ncbi:hypothetical protein B296_00053385, partial [Ensete ventricosum]